LGASNAFELCSAEALRYDVKDSGVPITALMPGPTDTQLFDRARMQDTNIGAKDNPTRVTAAGFPALMAGKDHVVAGSVKNAVQAAVTSVLTDTATAAVHANLTEPTPHPDQGTGAAFIVLSTRTSS